MRFVFYTHSLISDWNHGNAHFLRGVMRELAARGHSVEALEPADSWSRQNLVATQGQGAVDKFHRDFPVLPSTSYGHDFDHAAALADADVVVVHEWTDPALVAAIGRLRRRGGTFTLLFHDTHHRAVSATENIAELVLIDYDAILAFGETLRERYLAAGWGSRVFTWHEAADVALFSPRPETQNAGDLIWIGNWGDDERSEELRQFLIEPVRRLGISGMVQGVRYPSTALRELATAGLSYGGWIANADVPDAFTAHRVTVHVPRRPYVEALPGIPTIRVFEALACGIPLISAPWSDTEQLFRPGEDFLTAQDGAAMERRLRDVLNDPDLAQSLVKSGRETIERRHTCGHRVDELFAVLRTTGTRKVLDQLAGREAAQ